MRLILHIFFITTFCFLFSLELEAQMKLRPLGYTSPEVVSKSSRSRAVGDTLNLPFWDDFSNTTTSPNTVLWDSCRGIFINNTSALLAPTINVATFNGYDALGLPYSTLGQLHDTTDVLISKPIDLGAVRLDKRDSVVFSFYWQKGGASDAPEEADQMVLQFKDIAGEWHSELILSGDPTITNGQFKKESFLLQSLGKEYFHKGFQFKFFAIGNTAGPFDVWHIDYVYLNQDRVLSEFDENILDHAVSKPLTSIFGDYTKIPFDVFFNYSDTIFKVPEAEVYSLETAQDHQIDFTYTLTSYIETVNGRVDQIIPIPKPALVANVGSLVHKSVDAHEVALSFTDFQGLSETSIYLESKFIYDASDGYFPLEVDVTLENGSYTTEVKEYLSDEDYNYRLNDTISAYYDIHETLAYDDGTAELAAGIDNAGGQLAVEFFVPSQDTITHIDIYFPAMEALDIYTMYLSVYSDIYGADGEELRRQEFEIPSGSLLNSFARFEFDRAVIVSDHFFVVFEQGANSYVPIGLDMNSTNGTRVIHSKPKDDWLPNEEIDGVLMIRPIFSDSDFVVLDADLSEIKETRIYPNPTQGLLFIEGDFESYDVIDISGQQLLKGDNNTIDVSRFQNGIYYIRIASFNGSLTLKVIVRH